MKKIGLFLATGLMAVCLCACGKATSDEPNSGVYEGKSASMGGFDMDITDVFEGGFSVELNDKGKGKLHLDGDDASIKWSLDGDEFSAKGGGVELEGTLKNGVLEIKDVIGSGVDIVLVCDKIASDSGDAPKYTSVLDRLKAVKNGETVYGENAGDDGEWLDGGDDFWTDDGDWDLEGSGDDSSGEETDTDLGSDADVPVSQNAIDKGFDASWFGEGIVDAKVLAQFYVDYASMDSDAKSALSGIDLYDMLVETTGVKPMDDNEDEDDPDRFVFRYKSPDGGSLIVLLVKRDGQWEKASVSPSGDVSKAVDEIRGE